MATRDELLSADEAGKRIGVTGRQIHNLIRQGLLTATKVGRDYVIRPSDLAQVPAERKRGPKPKRESATAPKTAKGKARGKGKA